VWLAPSPTWRSSARPSDVHRGPGWIPCTSVSSGEQGRNYYYRGSRPPESCFCNNGTGIQNQKKLPGIAIKRVLIIFLHLKDKLSESHKFPVVSYNCHFGSPFQMAIQTDICDVKSLIHWQELLHCTYLTFQWRINSKVEGLP
jgi:hypothetical protein